MDNAAGQKRYPDDIVVPLLNEIRTEAQRCWEFSFQESDDTLVPHELNAYVAEEASVWLAVHNELAGYVHDQNELLSGLNSLGETEDVVAKFLHLVTAKISRDDRELFEWLLEAIQICQRSGLISIRESSPHSCHSNDDTSRTSECA